MRSSILKDNAEPTGPSKRVFIASLEDRQLLQMCFRVPQKILFDELAQHGDIRGSIAKRVFNQIDPTKVKHLQRWPIVVDFFVV